MATTALRIEILIIGFQAAIWILIGYGINDAVALYKNNISLIKDTSAVIILVIIAACYSIGAMIDSFTAALEDPVSLFKARTHGGRDSSIMRLKFPEAYEQLVSSDYELRLLRSTSFNFLIISASILIFTSYKATGVIVLVIGYLVGMGWYRRKMKTERRRKSLYEAAERLA